MDKTHILHPSEIAAAADLLKRGEVVAFPTETVYGLGARVFDPHAVAAIFALKKRPSDNPLIAHLSDLEDLGRIAQDIPKVLYSLYEKLCPGPLTFVLKAQESIPSIVRAGLDTIAVRFPQHPVARSLIHETGEPLVAPSANLSGKPSATKVEHVLQDFQGRLPAVLDGGECAIGIESTVIYLVNPEQPYLLRPGAITAEEIEAILGKKLLRWDNARKVPSPGMKYRHYAPDAPMRLIKQKEELHALFEEKSRYRLYLLPQGTSVPRDLPHFHFNARSLYDLLRQSDHSSYNEIIVYCDANTLSDEALMNRLEKAAGNSYESDRS